MTQKDVQPAEYQFTKKKIAWGLIALFAVYGAMAFYVQTKTIARPKIAADLDGMALYAWFVSIPGLVGAFITLVFGKFSDMYGRRIMLMISLSAFLIGMVLSAISPNFIFLIVANSIAALGSGSMMPLVFAGVADLFEPAKRGKWIGLLNIPLGIFTLTGPALGGLIVDTLNWRYLFWMELPLLIFCLITVPIGVPSLKSRDSKRKIDVKGCIWVALASSTTIMGFSWAGTTYPWLSTPIIGLLGVSLACWIIFIRVESGAKEAVLDLGVLRNRTFSTVALATFFSSFGAMGIMMYFPMFLQGVQDMSTFHSGFVTTPFGFLAAFMGVPIGYVMGKSSRFKWLYITGYGILSMSTFGLIFFSAETPIGLSVAVALLAGLGYGVIPTINTIVVQNAIPKDLMGAAMGALFFFLMMGNAISPAILGSTMNVSYESTLSQTLPEGLREFADDATMDSLGNPRVLLSESAMVKLKDTLQNETGNNGQLFHQTVETIRNSLETALRTVFWIGAIFTLLAFLTICTIPRSSIKKR